MMRAVVNAMKSWHTVRARARTVLGMNQRNLHYIYPYNRRRDFPLADDKIVTKEIMQRAGVPVPQTYRVYTHFYELRTVARDLDAYRDFVIKPSQGSGGGGIIVISERRGDGWAGPGGAIYHLDDVRKHLSDILFGVYSFDLHDRVLIEQRIAQHPEMTALSPFGLADVRVILLQDQPRLAMTRLPTRRSGGRANLHQGALGVGIDLATGRTTHAILKGEPVERHPDTGVRLIDRTIPFWSDVLRVAGLAARAVPLKYLGVDISLSETGPVLLEINVRPGLQIQNANEAGLRARLDQRAQP